MGSTATYNTKNRTGTIFLAGEFAYLVWSRSKYVKHVDVDLMIHVEP